MNVAVIVVAEAALPSLGRPSSDQWLNRIEDFAPGFVLGLTTIVATWQPTSVVFVAHLLEVPPSPV